MIARVVIDSPLPQLDRLFDYLVPAELESQLQQGIRVKVQFGRSKSLLDAFVVEVVGDTDYKGALSPISEIVSPAPVLDEQIYELVRAVADRQAAAAADVLRLAIPQRSVSIEKKWLESETVKQSRTTPMLGKLETELVQPLTTEAGPVWVAKIVADCLSAVENRQSVLAIVPDFRDQAALLDAFAEHATGAHIINFTSETQKSKRYAAFLACLSNEISIVVGSRSAIYAPVRNLGKILIWDDGDQSHLEPSSPYSHTREVALLRQKISGCDFKILGHSRSTEVSRLVSIGFLKDVSHSFTMPKIANSDSEIRVDSLAWRAIREGLDNGPVLIQVASRGVATSLFCGNCDKRAECRSCHGPLWLDERNHIKCRWCNAVNLDFKCNGCSGSKLKQGSAGTTRTISEFGKAFPGVQIVEATADIRTSALKRGKFLVVATPGAEPRVVGGYAAVIILDASKALYRDSLRATEDAIRTWSNAVALGGSNARNVLVGVAGSIANRFSLWSQAEISSQELQSRIELRFPPALRLASIGANQELIQVVLEDVKKVAGVEVLGPVPITNRGQDVEWRILLKYEYSKGAELAEILKALSLRLSAGQRRFSAKSGRAMRPIRIKMDDVEVI